MALTREQIEAVRDMPAPKEIDVPEWAGSVFVRMLDVGERGAWEDRCFDDAGKQKLRTRQFQAEVLVTMLCDAAGTVLFERDQLPALLRKHPDVVERLAVEALMFNGLDLKSAEETEKNLPAAQSDDSGTS